MLLWQVGGSFENLAKKFGPQVKKTHSKYENDGSRNSFGKKSSMKCSLGKRRLRFLGPLKLLLPKRFFLLEVRKV